MLSDWLVDRQIFRQADYQLALKSFRETIATESDPIRIFHTGEELIRSALRIADAAICANDTPEIVLAGAGFSGSGPAWKVLNYKKGKTPTLFLGCSPSPRPPSLFQYSIPFA